MQSENLKFGSDITSLGTHNEYQALLNRDECEAQNQNTNNTDPLTANATSYSHSTSSIILNNKDTEKPLCQGCQKLFNNVIEFNAHSLHCTGNGCNDASNILEHNCKYCEALFEKKRDLYKHYYEVHNVLIPLEKYDLSEAKSTIMQGDVGHRLLGSGVTNNLNLSMKLEKFDYEGLLKNEAVLGQNRLGNEEFLNYKLPLEGQALGEQYNFSCPLCPLTTVHQNELFEHIKTQHCFNNDISICPFCDRVFPDHNSLAVHVKRYHNNEDKTKTACCDLCGKRFCNPQYLETHYRSHTGEKPYVCKYCNKSFAAYCSLYRHVRIHTGFKPYKCEECGQEFSDSSVLARHRNVHCRDKMMMRNQFGTVYNYEVLPSFTQTCPNILNEPENPGPSEIISEKLVSFHNLGSNNSESPSKLFENFLKFDQNTNKLPELQEASSKILLSPKPSCSTVDKLESYLQEASLKIPLSPKPSCSTVDKISYQEQSSNISLKSPQPSCSRDNEDEERNVLKVEIIEEDEEEELNNSKLQCQTCSKLFTSSKSLKNHIRSIHLHHRPNQCELCEKKFVKKSDLAIHMRRHSGDRPFKCDRCAKQFYSHKDLINHTRSHTKELRYVCKTCGKAFTQSSSLSMHNKLHGMEEQVYKCTLCPKTFNWESGLSCHMRIHTGEGSCICEFCGKVYNRKADLAVHIRKHSGEKPFVCESCDKRFAVRSSLVKHIKAAHSGTARTHQCDQCGKLFCNEKYLVTHVRTHTGEKPHVCKYCNKSFAAYCSLYRHVRIHTGVKPYECKVCGRKFSDMSVLARHGRVHKTTEEAATSEQFQPTLPNSVGP